MILRKISSLKLSNFHHINQNNNFSKSNIQFFDRQNTFLFQNNNYLYTKQKQTKKELLLKRTRSSNRINSIINQQIQQAKTTQQLQSLFFKHRNIINAINLTTFTKKAFEISQQKDNVGQKNYLGKMLILQIKKKWKQFKLYFQNSRALINLILYLSNNNLYELNQAIMQIDLFEIYFRVNLIQKSMLIIAILNLGLQKSLNEKYFNRKQQLIDKIYYVKMRPQLKQHLKNENIINLLIYALPNDQNKYLISMWRAVIQHGVPTKFLNDHMFGIISKQAYLQRLIKGNMRNYIYLLQCILKSKNSQDKSVDISKIVKKYPQSSQDNKLRSYQLSIFYNLVSNIEQLKELIINEQKQGKQNSLMKRIQKQHVNQLAIQWKSVKRISLTFKQAQKIKNIYKFQYVLDGVIEALTKFLIAYSKNQIQIKKQSCLYLLKTCIYTIKMQRDYNLKNSHQIDNLAFEMVKFLELNQNYFFNGIRQINHILTFFSHYRLNIKHFCLIQKRKFTQEETKMFWLYNLYQFLPQIIIKKLKEQSSIQKTSFEILIKYIFDLQIKNKQLCKIIHEKQKELEKKKIQSKLFEQRQVKHCPLNHQQKYCLKCLQETHFKEVRKGKDFNKQSKKPKKQIKVEQIIKISSQFQEKNKKETQSKQQQKIGYSQIMFARKISKKQSTYQKKQKNNLQDKKMIPYNKKQLFKKDYFPNSFQKKLKSKKNINKTNQYDTKQ